MSHPSVGPGPELEGRLERMIRVFGDPALRRLLRMHLGVGRDRPLTEEEIAVALDMPVEEVVRDLRQALGMLLLPEGGDPTRSLPRITIRREGEG